MTRTDTHKNLPQAVVKTDLEAIKVKSEKGRKRKRDEGDSETEVEARNTNIVCTPKKLKPTVSPGILKLKRLF